MPHPHLDIDAVRRSAAGRWDAILTDLAPSLAPALARPGRHVTCPVHGGQGDFRVFRDFAVTGGGICSCGAFPDGFALLSWANQWRFPDALAAVARWLGMDPGATTLPPPVTTVPVLHTRQTAADPAADARRRERLQQTWDTALPLWDPQALPARRYLARRGLTLAMYPAFLRLHPALPYFNEEGTETGRWPTLLAVVSDADGQPVTLHRTYLTAEGTKAPVEPVKKLMTYTSEWMLTGGVIRLFPAPARTHCSFIGQTACHPSGRS